LRWAIECNRVSDDSYVVRIPFRVAQVHAQSITGQFERKNIKLVEDAESPVQLTETRPGDVILFLRGSETAIGEAVKAAREWVAAHVNPDDWNRELTFIWTRCQPIFKQDPATGAWKIRHQAFTAPVDPSQLEGDNPDLKGAMGREYVL